MANIVIFGPPGSGKGTQAALLSESFGLPHISTGNILRHCIESGTALGLKAKGYMDSGELVPDEIVDEMVSERLSQTDCVSGFILDGFPRDIHQAHALDEFSKIDMVLDIRVADDEIVKRVGQRMVCECGQTYSVPDNPPKKRGVCDICSERLQRRDDDTPETVLRRLEVYHKKTEPLIGFYRKRGLLREIDGSLDIEGVKKQIFDAVSGVSG